MSKAIEPFENTTVDALLRRQAELYSDQPFILLQDQVWSYGLIEERAGSLAAGLRHLGLKPGDRLAVILPNSPAYMVTLFGSTWAGLILVPINTRRSSKEMLARLSITRPKAVITSSDATTSPDSDPLKNVLSARTELPDLEHIIVLKGHTKQTVSWDDLIMSGAPTPDPSAKPKDPVAIVHTLGSSGEPRGATLIHQGVVRNAAGLASIMECKPEDVFLGCVPFSNAFGLSPTILACTVSGALMVPMRRFDPGKALDLIERAHVTVHHGVPTMFALELNHPEFAKERCSSLRTGIMAGAACPPELARRVREEMGMDLILAYGLTEASPSVTTTRLHDGPVTASETVGRPMDGIEIKVIGSDGSSLPPGQEGELCVRGYNIMQGYWE
ncbi:MAG: AMP-binding protein, partial [Anaerolineales bacterium]